MKKHLIALMIFVVGLAAVAMVVPPAKNSDCDCIPTPTEELK